MQRQNLATRLCKSKLNEVISGVVPLSSQGDSPFDEEPDYSWSLDAEQNGSVDGLWNVTVRVTRTQTDAGDPIECSVTQMVLDPSIEGSTQDAIPVTVSTDNTNIGIVHVRIILHEFRRLDVLDLPSVSSSPGK